MTFSIMTLSIPKKADNQRNAEHCYVECHYAACHGAFIPNSIKISPTIFCNKLIKILTTVSSYANNVKLWTDVSYRAKPGWVFNLRSGNVCACHAKHSQHQNSLTLIQKLVATTISVMTFSIMTLSITKIKAHIQRNAEHCYAECHYAACQGAFIPNSIKISPTIFLTN